MCTWIDKAAKTAYTCQGALILLLLQRVLAFSAQLGFLKWRKICESF